MVPAVGNRVALKKGHPGEGEGLFSSEIDKLALSIRKVSQLLAAHGFPSTFTWGRQDLVAE
jgi:hypothetical protein